MDDRGSEGVLRLHWLLITLIRPGPHYARRSENHTLHMYPRHFSTGDLANGLIRQKESEASHHRS